MKSRFLVGSALLASVTIAIGTAAIAQERGALRQKLIERIREKGALPSDPNPTRITAPGTYRFHFTHGGLRREYIVHVPKTRPAGPTPILMALHGGGGDMDFQAKNYGLIEKSEAAGFIAVFPSGYSRFPGGILATWNAGKCCGHARDKAIDDVGFLKEVVQRVSHQANGHLGRVFVTGMSNGAMMAYRLACEAPQMIRGIAAVAGTDNTNVCNPARPVPVIHFHARDDTHVLFTGGAGKDAFRDRAMVTDFSSVPATIAKWVAIDRADPKARQVLKVPGAMCERHAGLAPVELCVSDTGGHSWPGTQSQRANKAPSQAISANDRIWDFFSSLNH